jgi:hypothetical protein
MVPGRPGACGPWPGRRRPAPQTPVQPGQTRSGQARPGQARTLARLPGPPHRPGPVRPGLNRPGLNRCGPNRCGLDRCGSLRLGPDRAHFPAAVPEAPAHGAAAGSPVARTTRRSQAESRQESHWVSPACGACRPSRRKVRGARPGRPAWALGPCRRAPASWNHVPKPWNHGSKNHAARCGHDSSGVRLNAHAPEGGSATARTCPALPVTLPGRQGMPDPRDRHLR